MTTAPKDDDTDPSTPAARRSSRPPLKPAGTDPGIGEALTEPVAPPDHPLGIVVPAPGAAARPQGLPAAGPAGISTLTPTPAPPAEGGAGAGSRPAGAPLPPKKDSVEILLDGMTEQRLERTRTTPQSQGAAAAAYHAEHEPVAARHSGDTGEDVPKVVVMDRPLTPTSIRPRPMGVPNPASAEATLPPAPHLGRRVAAGAALGVLVSAIVFAVLEIFAARRSANEAAAAAAAAAASAAAPLPATTSAVQVAQPLATATAPTAPPTAAVPASPTASASASAVSVSGGTVHPPGAHKKRTKGAPAGTDLGEFRTNF